MLGATITHFGETCPFRWKASCVCKSRLLFVDVALLVLLSQTLCLSIQVILG